MSGPIVAGFVLSTVAGGLLLVSGLQHARDSTSFSKAVADQGVLPGPASVWARVVTLSEIIVGLSVLIAVWLDIAATTRVIALGLASLEYLAFGLYSVIVKLRSPGVSCGCGGVDAPVNGWTIARALGLSAGLALAAPQTAIGPRTLSEFFVIAAASVSLSIGALLLPNAMSLAPKEV